MMINVSVIIPVYNVEKYLVDCLESVIQQSMREIEIICVNDGSTDSSYDILSEYADKDPRILILNKENKGLSAARNTGLRKASGKYILFLDSDDYLSSPDILESLCKKADKEELDQLYFDAKVVFENENVKAANSNYITYYQRKKNYTDILSGKELFCEFQSVWDFKPHVCMQFYRKRFLEDCKLIFCENLLHEDEVFTVECAAFAKRAGYINTLGLTRRIRENSIMTTRQKASSIYGYYDGAKELLDFAKRNLSIEDEPFMHFYLQRVRVMMESAVKLLCKEDKEKKKILMEKGEAQEQFEFAADMQVWQNIVSLKETNLQIKETRRKEKEDSKKQIEELKKHIEEKKQVIENLSLDLRQEKQVVEKLKKELNEEKNTHEILEQKMKEKDEKLKKTAKNLEKEKRKLIEIKQSTTFKAGKIVMWIPKKIKIMLKKIKYHINKQ